MEDRRVLAVDVPFLLSDEQMAAAPELLVPADEFGEIYLDNIISNDGTGDDGLTEIRKFSLGEIEGSLESSDFFAASEFGFAAPGGSTTGSRLAVYDQDGNLLQSAEQGFFGGSEIEVELALGHVYYLGIFSDLETGLTQSLRAGHHMTTSQSSRLLPDPSTGKLASFETEFGGNGLDSPVDVSFFPIEFLNATTTATIQVESLVTDASLSISLLRNSSSGWEPIATSVGTGSHELDVTGSGGLGLDSFDYLVGVTTQGFEGLSTNLRISIDGEAAGPAELLGRFTRRHLEIDTLESNQ
ncbi:MAG: hypothetical protein KDA60_19970, partial [Planctomycetales bacterium]|nr:hypothetical protein [Planctomycetales bacterium]